MRLTAVVFFCFLYAPLAASPIPEISTSTLALWELGVVAGVAHLPDYPASDENRLKGIGAPYFVYRGDILRADREGARARLARYKRVELEMSFAAAFASSSKDNDARRGMPDIDYLLETGPRLAASLSDFGGRGKLRVFVPVRAVFSTDFGYFRHRGWTTTPALNARVQFSPKSDAMLISQLTGNFGSRQLLAYFYDVTPQYATALRPAYDAHGGYIGTDLFVGVLVPIKRRWRLFSGVQFNVHDGAANEGSPLFRKSKTVTGVFGLSWLFLESKRRAATYAAGL